MKNEEDKVIRGTLVFLSRYIKEHFRDEEVYMKENKYPGLQEHKRLHQVFIKSYEAFEEEYTHGRSVSNLVVKVKSFLGEWWMDHIAIIDYQYAEYIEQRKMKR